MKNIINICIVIGVLFFFSSCKKAENYTVSGFLYLDCSKTQVMKGVNIQIVGSTAGFGAPAAMGQGYTDDRGYFSFTYNDKELNSRSVLIRAFSNSGIGLVDLGSMDSSQDLVGLTLYMDPKVTVPIKITTNRTFTNNDTLYFGTQTFPLFPIIKVVNPSNGQIIGTTTGSILDGRKPFPWGIGYSDFNRSNYSGNNPYQLLYYTFPPCETQKELVLNIP